VDEHERLRAGGRAGESTYRADCPDWSLVANGQKGDFVKRAFLRRRSGRGFRELERINRKDFREDE
jgi:hypothetical protein